MKSPGSGKGFNNYAVQGSRVQAFKVGFGGDEDGMGSFKVQGSSVQGQISGQGPK
jgi:hypothetical protein